MHETTRGQGFVFTLEILWQVPFFPENPLRWSSGDSAPLIIHCKACKWTVESSHCDIQDDGRISSHTALIPPSGRPSRRSVLWRRPTAIWDPRTGASCPCLEWPDLVTFVSRFYRNLDKFGDKITKSGHSVRAQEFGEFVAVESGLALAYPIRGRYEWIAGNEIKH